MVGLLQPGNLLQAEAGALESADIQAFRFHVESRVQEERRDVEIDARVTANHGETADLRVLVDYYAAGNEGIVFHFDMSGDERAACDDSIAADRAIVRDMARRHDVVVIADGGDGFGLRSARDRIVLADLVAAADSQIGAVAFEILVERIRAQHGAGGDFVALAECSPALYENVGFEKAVRADFNIRLDHAEFADAGSGADAGAWIDSSSGRNSGGGVDGHGFHHSDAIRRENNSG